MDPEQTTNPTPDTPVTPPAAQESTQPAAENTSPVLQKLAELGFENVGSEQDGIERLITAYKQQREQFGSQIKEALSELRSTVAPPPQPVEQPGQTWWNPPAVDLNLANRFRTPDGQWKDGTPAEIRQQVEAYEAYRTNFANKFLENPKDALRPAVQEMFEEFFDQKYGQLNAQQREQQFFDKAFAENQWLFEKDPTTGRVNQQKLTPEGQRFNELMVHAYEEFGVRDRTKQFEFAMRMRAAEKAASAAKAPTPEQAAATNDQRKQDFLNRAAPALNRNGSLPQPGATPPRNRNLTPGQKLKQQMQLDGASH
jgi:hypothetical protein